MDKIGASSKSSDANNTFEMRAISLKDILKRKRIDDRFETECYVM